MVLEKKTRQTGTSCKVIIMQGGDSATREPGKRARQRSWEGRGDDRQLRPAEHYQAASVMNPEALLPLDLLEVVFFSR